MVRLLERVASEAPGNKYLLMGDSAGGGLAIGLTLALRDQSKTSAMPTELVLSSPWTDIVLDTPELVQQNSRVIIPYALCMMQLTWHYIHRILG